MWKCISEEIQVLYALVLYSSIVPHLETKALN
jgi:hypothetical protein